jgi:hypothetical protein
MKLRRRQFLSVAAGAATLPVTSRFAGAENYPTRPVHLVVGFFPGGLTDILARILTVSLSQRLGQQFTQLTYSLLISRQSIFHWQLYGKATSEAIRRSVCISSLSALTPAHRTLPTLYFLSVALPAPRAFGGFA